jgi:hypothetical protein
MISLKSLTGLVRVSIQVHPVRCCIYFVDLYTNLLNFRTLQATSSHVKNMARRSNWSFV